MSESSLDIMFKPPLFEKSSEQTWNHN
uniref:Uncharacterized protein n=1 Tax=Anguilla anguilla TaxID=7936 RepID=A0A0E9QJI9_ANGAN